MLGDQGAEVTATTHAGGQTRRSGGEQKGEGVGVGGGARQTDRLWLALKEAIEKSYLVREYYILI